MKLEMLKMQSDSNKFARKANRDSSMATKGCRDAERKNPELMSTVERGKELVDIRERIEEPELKMRRDKKPRWVYEWPMKKPKMKWPVKQLMVIRQHRLLRRWLRYAENLKTTEEEMVQICEPQTGDILGEENELGSAGDLKHCQEGRREIPVFQVGNELRLAGDLTDCQEDSQKILHCQQGNGSRSLQDLINCQEGSREIPCFHVDRDEQMNS
jgi:hypothetical protein